MSGKLRKLGKNEANFGTSIVRSCRKTKPILGGRFLPQTLESQDIAAEPRPRGTVLPIFFTRTNPIFGLPPNGAVRHTRLIPGRFGARLQMAPPLDRHIAATIRTGKNKANFRGSPESWASALHYESGPGVWLVSLSQRLVPDF
jgi:hypothetical protein